MSDTEFEVMGITTLNAKSGPDLIKQILKSTEQQIDDEGWDQPPMVAVLYAGVEPEDSTAGTGTLWLTELPIPDFLKHDLREAMPVLTTLYSTVLKDQIVDNEHTKPIGVLLSTEAWMLRMPKDVEEIPDSYREAQQNRTIHEHPDRTEVRQVTVCMRNGQLMAAFRVRGEEAEVRVDGEDEFHLHGHMVDCLRRFAVAVLYPDEVQS